MSYFDRGFGKYYGSVSDSFDFNVAIPFGNLSLVTFCHMKQLTPISKRLQG